MNPFLRAADAGRKPLFTSRRFRVAFHLLSAASVAAAVVGLAVPRERAARTRADLARLLEDVQAAAERHQAALRDHAAGDLTAAGMADRLEHGTLPLWTDLAARAAALGADGSHADASHGPGSLADSLALRRDATASLAAAFRTGNEATLKAAERAWAEADRVDRRDRPRQ